MPRLLSQTTSFIARLKRMPMARFFFLVTCTSLALSYFYIQLASFPLESTWNENLIQEAIENVAKDPRYSEVYRKTSKLSKDIKTILLWTPRDYAPFYYFGTGQRAFIKANCSVINCYVTNDRSFFNGDIKKFDAIAFNGRNMRTDDLPKNRSTHQKYIYFNMESAENFPVCNAIYDGFFNWTATYRLDSDVPFPYLAIKDNNGHVVGPKANMVWKRNIPKIDDEYAERLQNKTKAAAWFVSNCGGRSGRSSFVKRLQIALARYGHSVDIYGLCGPLKCPRDKSNYCDSLLERNYFFYLSLENSFAPDYVTEKLLNALHHDTVPIVYGGASYSRFLPPNSYLQGEKFHEEALAKTIDRLMNTPKAYRQYFNWKTSYSYSDPKDVENVCSLCAALNNKEMVEKTTVYHNFRKWWFKTYNKRC